jgi:hypothetical protein
MQDMYISCLINMHQAVASRCTPASILVGLREHCTLRTITPCASAPLIPACPSLHLLDLRRQRTTNGLGEYCSEDPHKYI